MEQGSFDNRGPRRFGGPRGPRRFGGPRRDGPGYGGPRRDGPRYGGPRDGPRDGPREERQEYPEERPQEQPEELPPEGPPENAAPPLVKEREVVVPGQELCIGLDYLPSSGTYRLNDKILASLYGLVQFRGRLVSIIPLSGRYHPVQGDVVVGKVSDILISGWRLEINSAYSAVLGIVNTVGYIRKGEDLTRYFKIGDYIVTKIINVTSQNLIDVTMKGPGLRKLTGGRIVTVVPSKVPRLIGKGGSMVDEIQKATQCEMVVGQNGAVWLQGQPESELLAVEVIRKIQAESHLSGLSQRVADYLKERGATPAPEVTP